MDALVSAIDPVYVWTDYKARPADHVYKSPVYLSQDSSEQQADPAS